MSSFLQVISNTDQFDGYELEKLIKAAPRLYLKHPEYDRKQIRNHIKTNIKGFQHWLEEVAKKDFSLDELNNLKELSLSYKGLTSVPASIGQLSSLKKLYLHNNQLNKLPPEIGQLSNLQMLRLEGNKFTPQEQVRIKGMLPNTRVNF